MSKISIPRGVWRVRSSKGEEFDIEADWPKEDEMSDDAEGYLAECQRLALDKLRFFAGLEKKDEQALLDVVETLIDVRLARLGLIPPQPPRVSLSE